MATQTIDSDQPRREEDGRRSTTSARRRSSKTTVHVDVQPVKGEAQPANNTLEYPVIFSLASERVGLDRGLDRDRAALRRAGRARARGLRPASGCARPGAQQVLLGGGRPTSSTSPSRSRRGSTTSTARWTRSRPGSPASTGASTARSRRPRSSATTPTRARRPPVRLGRAARRGPHRHRPQRDPGPRLRAHLREGARPRPRLGRALAGGGGGGRARDGAGSVPALGIFLGPVQQVLVLNASYEPLNVCSVRRAHVLVYKGKAEVLEALDQPLRSARTRSRGRT